jgi:tetratricopeptide (TPR) repeat protein
MGKLYASQGIYDKALQLYEKSLNIKLAILGDKHPSTATATYFNMAAMFEQQALYQQAADCFAKTYTVYATTFGDDHYKTLEVAHRLAAVRERRRKNS